MKLNLFNTAFSKALFAVAIIATLGIVACVKQDDLTKDLGIYFNSKIFDTPVTLQFIDANTEKPAYPKNVTLEIIGRDKERIFSVLGTKNLKIEENFTILCTKVDNRPSRETPITIHVIAHADGYLDAIVPITITNSQKPEALSVPMISKTSPPKGVSIVETSFQADALGLVAPVTLSTPNTNGKTENASALIPLGTKFYDESGKQLSGIVQATLVHFDNRNADALRAFPGGLTPTYLVDEAGKQLNPGNFVTAGFIAFDMTVGGVEVKTFSNPVEVAVDLNEQQDNPETKKPMAAGDKLPIWSFDEKNGVWKQEVTIDIVSEGGKLKAKYEQKHLSWWNLDWFFSYGCNLSGYYNFSWGNPFPWGPPIPPGPPTTGIITLQSNITPPVTSCNQSGWWNSSSRIYYAELYDPSNPYGGFVHPYWDNFHNGTQIQLANYVGGGMLPGFPVKLRIFSGNNWWNRGTVIYESGNIYLCNNPTINVTLPTPAPPLSIEVNVSGTCGSTTIYPSMYFLFRNTSDFYWNYLGYLYNGVGCTTTLKRGQRYHFSVNYGPLQRTYNNITIPQNDTTYIVKNPLTGLNENLNIQYAPNNKIIFNVQNMVVPQTLCPF